MRSGLTQKTAGDSLAISLTDDRARNRHLVGGKAANLASIIHLPGIRVPPGFVITTAAYRLFLREHPELTQMITKLDDLTDLETIREQALRIQDAMRAADIPDPVRAAIGNAHAIMGFRQDMSGLRVSVRSSATAEDGGTASFAGQFETHLNQRSPADVVESVRRVWASTFGPNPVSYRIARRLAQSAEMAVVLMKMVDARAAGTAFTVDLETGAPMIRVHASHGLGEAEVRGSVTPDVWIVDPVSLIVIKRTLGEKQEKVTYDCTLGQTVSRPTTSDEREGYALRCGEVRDLAHQVRSIGEHYRRSQGAGHVDVEFAVDGDGMIYLIQARPETAWAERTCRLVAVDLNRARVHPRLFLGGFTAAPGVVTGPLCVARSIDEAERKIRPGHILAVPNTSNIWERVLGLSSGAITDIGGPGSHTATIMREQGKAALTGAAGATAILKDHEGEVVTLDATQRLLFFGIVPEEWLFSPHELTPAYGSADSETEEESWDEATRSGQTSTATDGRRWIGKPKHHVSRFMQEVYLACHASVARRLGAPIHAEVRDGIHWVDFHDLWQWRLKLRGLPLEQLEELHRERRATAHDYLEACDRVSLNPDSVFRWLRLFIHMNSFMSVAYHIYKVTEGWLEHELSSRRTPEPYYSQVRTAIGALVGESEATRELRDYMAILDLTRSTSARLKVVRSAAESGDLSGISQNEPTLYRRLEEHAVQYKIVRNTDIARPLEESILELAARLDSDLQHNREVSLTQATGAEFYPEDKRFVRIARLTVESEIARQDAHHLNHRGHWPVRERLNPLVEWLASHGEISSFANLFDYPPDWLLRQVARFRMARWLEDFLGRPCKVPAVPDELSLERFGQLRSMGFDLIYLPPLGAVSASSFGQFPGWRHPLSNRYWLAGMSGRPLSAGGWVAVETGDGGPDNPGRLASWDALHEAILPEVSRLLRVEHSRVRLPSAIEWNLLGNLLRHRRQMGDDPPDWGKTGAWEWTSDRDVRGQHIVVGSDGAGGLDGLEAVDWVDASHAATLRFHALVVL